MNRLHSKLQEYAETDVYPFHMPGHKRQLPPYRMDITEITEFDDLHDPTGLILEAEQQAAALFGAEKSFLLVNGSSGGILSAISACCSYGDEILIARNCHRSVYHGIWLMGLKASYIYPEHVPGFSVCGGIRPGDVRRAMEAAPSCRVVVITSPTYEGVVSDIRGIADIVHERGGVLIVDEAHGAHLPFCRDRFAGRGMVSSVQAGADLVIQSLHKTLPSPTQTGILHLCSHRVDEKRLRDYLRVYQTSSPSYLLMAGIGDCLNLLEEKAEALFSSYEKRLFRFEEQTADLKHFKLLCLSDVRPFGGFGMDAGKIVIASDEACACPGDRLFQRLRDVYHLECEMRAGSYVVAMTSIMDTDEGFGRLSEALHEMDSMREKTTDPGQNRETSCGKDVLSRGRELPLVSAMTIAGALLAEQEEVPREKLPGRICGEFLYMYPPGIPMIAPGEIFTEEVLAAIEAAEASEAGLFRKEKAGCISCVKR